jgi:hypothetical protein
VAALLRVARLSGFEKQKLQASVYKKTSHPLGGFFFDILK